MKLLFGVAVGLVGYAAWKLSEPEAGEASDMSSRMARLRAEWQRAVLQGKAAGAEKRREMETEFERTAFGET